MTMSVFEIIGAVVMLVVAIGIIVFVLLQEGTKGGGLAALSGGENDSFFSKNPSRTREAMLFKATKFCAILFFVVTLAVYAAGVFVVQ